MKPSIRLNRFRISPDPLSSFLSGFRYDIVYFTNWPQQDNKSLNNIVSTCIKLVLQESGEAEITAGDTHLHIGAGSAVLIPPYTVYSAKTYEQVNSFEIFFNIIPVTHEQAFLTRLNAANICQYDGLLTQSDFDLLRAVYADIREGRDGGYARLHALITELIVRISRTLPQASALTAVSAKEQAIIDRLLAYIDEHIAEPVRVDEICRALQVSQSYLYRCSRSVMNCSTQEVITRHKMVRARLLLHNSEMTISDVAEAVGYDPYHFSSQFRKSFLQSPSEYRKR